MSLYTSPRAPLPEFPKFPESVGTLNGKACGIRILHDDPGRFGKFEKNICSGFPKKKGRRSPLANRLKIQYSGAP